MALDRFPDRPGDAKLYRRCPRCTLILIEPRHQRDHRCPRCLVGESVGVVMEPTLLGEGTHPNGPVKAGPVLKQTTIAR